MLLEPKNGIRNRGKQTNTFIDILKDDCDCEEDELRTLMIGRERWNVIVRSGRVRHRLK